MKSKQAVALRYNQQEDSAPKVVARGKGIVAEKIIEVAEKAGVYIQEDEDLVELLGHIDLQTEIPTELYQAVTEVLAFVYQVNGKFKGL